MAALWLQQVLLQSSCRVRPVNLVTWLATFPPAHIRPHRRISCKPFACPPARHLYKKFFFPQIHVRQAPGCNADSRKLRFLYASTDRTVVRNCREGRGMVEEWRRGCDGYTCSMAKNSCYVTARIKPHAAALVWTFIQDIATNCTQQNLSLIMAREKNQPEIYTGQDLFQVT